MLTKVSKREFQLKLNKYLKAPGRYRIYGRNEYWDIEIGNVNKDPNYTDVNKPDVNKENVSKPVSKDIKEDFKKIDTVEAAEKVAAGLNAEGVKKWSNVYR